MVADNVIPLPRRPRAPIPCDVWRPVPNHDGYEVSDTGLVRSLARRVQHSDGVVTRRAGCLLKPSLGKYGHLRVRLSRDGKTCGHFVHALVLLAFVGPRPTGQQVRHLDGDAGNNHLENLRYGTATENMQDRLRHGTNPNANKTHCVQGHPYDADNTRISDRGWRYCRTCRRLQERARTARLRSQVEVSA